MADNNDYFADVTPEATGEVQGAKPAEPASNAVPAGENFSNPESMQPNGNSFSSVNDPYANPAASNPQPGNGAYVNPNPGFAQPGNDAYANPNAGYTQPGNGPYANPNPNAGFAQPGNTQAEPSANDKSFEKPKEQKPKKKFSLKEWVPGPQVPNQLTIARICMIPLFVVFIMWVPKPVGNILAMITFIVASLTDTADGYIARRYNYVSTFGKFMDPLADKLLVCSGLICLVDLGRIESWIVIIIIAREFIISGFRLIAAERGVVIAANFWGKIKTIAQMLMVILMVGNFGGFLGTVAQILKWAALALTLISLLTYMFQNRNLLKDNV